MNASRRTYTTLLLAALMVGMAAGGDRDTHAMPLSIAWHINSRTIPSRQVFELVIRNPTVYDDPFRDVEIELVLTSPSGARRRVGGFYYGSLEPPVIQRSEVDPVSREAKGVRYLSDRGDAWKVRFSPDELGMWRYEFVVEDAAGRTARGSGIFTVVPAAREARGYLERDPSRPLRLRYQNGAPFFPFGFQDCFRDNGGTGTVLNTAALEGPFSLDRHAELPAGPVFVRSPKSTTFNTDVYFRRMRTAGFNLFRFSQANCSFRVMKNVDSWGTHEAVMVDELLVQARKYGFSVMYGIFGFLDVSANNPQARDALDKVKRFVKYSVDRWGAYVDIWEVLNEQRANARWYREVIRYLRSLDPYRHLVTTSWERPELDEIDINAPHWFENEDKLESNSVTEARIDHWQREGKPVIVGEQGNSTPGRCFTLFGSTRLCLSRPWPLGVPGVWDPGSAARMRVRNWTAFFHEAGLVYWVTSAARDANSHNIWFGPQEREYMRALTSFASRLDGEVKPVAAKVSDPAAVRAHALASGRSLGVYLHHHATHDEPAAGIALTLEATPPGRAYWYDPASGAILGTIEVGGGRQVFRAPDFAVDMALLITSSGPPDVDLDGADNNADPDDDNDGVLDAVDAFPLDPEEWADVDRDLIGDNLDMDTSGDGVSEDRDSDGTPDAREWDLDGDGIDQGGSVPWDAFPFDPREWKDTDGDGQGDGADPDDDGDGYTDEAERQAGTDPLDGVLFPTPP